MNTIPKDLEQALRQTQESLVQTEQHLLQTQKKFQELTEAVAKHFAEDDKGEHVGSSSHKIISTATTPEILTTTQSAPPDKTPSVWQNLLSKTGTVIGAAGVPLTQLMTKAVNRPPTSVLSNSSEDIEEVVDVAVGMKPVENDIPNMLIHAQQVIIVPGYGMAVAQAQHKIWELAKALGKYGVSVKFALHPVAGRMPGHIDVLLAEAGIPYDMIFVLEEINAEFAQTDVALVIGANDVINPVARTDPSSPIYGMPILNADRAKNIIAIKRGQGTGFTGIENSLFHADNTYMLYGDGQKMVAGLLQQIKSL